MKKCECGKEATICVSCRGAEIFHLCPVCWHRALKEQSVFDSRNIKEIKDVTQVG